ncbi:hypothetical protein GDO86_018011 [Hymenochirus boettgeri]|uniref:Scaffolding anchor of CK1 domain-containing protein n=1 Tax=Hymenochirus boettgeri TaxID=247094 RepID=A0A8T2IF45_9PIPI|nr:hypothetical protein GDO86_018011 [Hymenochirus boettgeri]
MARRSQSSSQGDNPLDPNYLPPHYKEYYRIAIDALAEDGLEGYERFLKEEGAPEFLCPSEIEHITRCLHRPPEVSQETSYTDTGYRTQDDADGSSGTYWAKFIQIQQHQNWILAGPRTMGSKAQR